MYMKACGDSVSSSSMKMTEGWNHGTDEAKRCTDFQVGVLKNHSPLNHLHHDTPLEYGILAGLGILEHYNLDKKDEENATVSMEVTRTAACNFSTGNPWIAIVKVNGLFLSLTFFADALNICTRNSALKETVDAKFSSGELRREHLNGRYG